VRSAKLPPEIEQLKSLPPSPSPDEERSKIRQMEDTGSDPATLNSDREGFWLTSRGAEAVAMEV
jgi:hypothetical protein